jgi:hypothetical protein
MSYNYMLSEFLTFAILASLREHFFNQAYILPANKPLIRTISGVG